MACPGNESVHLKASEVGEMAQLLRELTALVEKLSSVSSTHIRFLTTTWNSSSRGSDTCHLSGHWHSQAGKYTHTLKAEDHS